MPADSPIHSWKNEADAGVSAARVVEWLAEEIIINAEQNAIQRKKIRFLLESLRASLLQDLSGYFLSNNAKKEDKKAGRFARLHFMLLAIAGTLLAVCEGFDGIASILSLFKAVPISLVFSAGIGFALLSVVVFYGFDMVAISQNLDVSLGKSRYLLDVFLEQVDQIEQLRKYIDDRSGSKDLDELKVLGLMSDMLLKRYDNLDSAREAYTKDLNRPVLRVAKLVTAALTGVLFFGGGFFSGESLALAFAGLFSAATAATFWPVLLVSVITGLAAFFVYWSVERPGLENLVGSWFGLDHEKVESLANTDQVKDQKEQLLKLNDRLKSQTLYCKDALETAKREKQLTAEHRILSKAHREASAVASAQPHSLRFHAIKRSRSLNDLNIEVGPYSLGESELATRVAYNP